MKLSRVTSSPACLLVICAQCCLHASSVLSAYVPATASTTYTLVGNNATDSSPGPTGRSGGGPGRGQKFLAYNHPPGSIGHKMGLMSQSHIQFTLDLLTSLVVTQGYNPATRLLDSLVLSPISLQSILLMLHLGARGNTRGDIARALHLHPSLAGANNASYYEIHELYGQAVADLLNDPATLSGLNSQQQGKVLNSANGVFIRDSLQIAPTFQHALARYHSTTGVRQMDFEQDPAGSQELINEWVEKQTRGEIRQILASPPPSSTQLMAINALYFKGDWKYRFDPADTEPEAWFYTTNGQTASVPMMVARLPVAYGYSPALATSIIELPYKSARLSMFALLPDDHRVGLFTLLRQLNATSFTSLIVSMRKTGPGSPAGRQQDGGAGSEGVSIRFPSFNVESAPLMSSVLKNHLGLRSLFSNGEADLSGLFTNLEGPTHVNDILHRALLRVDETGATGAAVSVSVIERVGSFAGPYFEADHPFLYFLMDKQTGLILFAGIYAGPHQPTGGTQGGIQPGPGPGIAANSVNPV